LRNEHATVLADAAIRAVAGASFISRSTGAFYLRDAMGQLRPQHM
jgi:hypothetical protein